MKDDTISRQAAIDTAEWAYKACEGNLSYYHDLLVAALMDLTPARPVWVPCKIRKPKKDGEYSVTYRGCEGLAVASDYYHVNVDEWEAIGSVIAWCPLPEPWKGEQE